MAEELKNDQNMAQISASIVILTTTLAALTQRLPTEQLEDEDLDLTQQVKDIKLVLVRTQVD